MATSFFNRRRLPSNLFIYVGILLVFLVMGIWGGRSIGSSGIFSSSFLLPSDSSNVELAPTDFPATGQNNLLVIGVDSLTGTQPRLESIWLVMYFPGEPDITFLPIYPNPSDGADQSISALPASFSLDASGNPSPSFLEQLSNRGWWNNYLVLDQTAMIALIDLLGGFPQDGLYLDGAHILAEMPSAWLDSSAAYTAQTTLLSGLCGKAGGFPISMKPIAATLSSIDANLATDLDLMNILDAWLDKGGDSLDFHCEFPLLSSTVR